MANRAWLYCRIGVGYEHQEKELLDKQEQRLLDYCAQQGLQVAGTTKTIGSSKGELEKLTSQGLEQNTFDFLVTVSASRLSRDTMHLLTCAQKLADNGIGICMVNEGFAIDARVPSILITGGSNFPVRQKEKQNAARDRNMAEWRDIQGLLDKIRSTDMGGISADDPQAIAKLESKLAGLERAQERMKEVNAYYRKHKTLDGCPLLSSEQIEQLKADMNNGWHLEDKPYPTWALSNNSAEIRRVKGRIASLAAHKTARYEGWNFDGGHVEANTEDNRLQVFFDEKPDADTRATLKSNGFRWSPNTGAWQRQLNNNALYAAKHLDFLQPVRDESLSEDGQDELEQNGDMQIL